MKKPAVLIVTGRKKSGKTFLLERLIPVLKKRNIRLGVIKHDFHDTFGWEEEGKDTDRFWKSGADAVAIISPTRYGLKFRTQKEIELPDFIKRHAGDLDLVLVEGFHLLPFPKLEVIRSDIAQEPLMPPGLIAVVADKDLSGSTRFFRMEEVEILADFLIEYFSLG